MTLGKQYTPLGQPRPGHTVSELWYAVNYLLMFLWSYFRLDCYISAFLQLSTEFSFKCISRIIAKISSNNYCLTHASSKIRQKFQIIILKKILISTIRKFVYFHTRKAINEVMNQNEYFCLMPISMRGRQMASDPQLNYLVSKITPGHGGGGR